MTSEAGRAKATREAGRTQSPELTNEEILSSVRKYGALFDYCPSESDAYPSESEIDDSESSEEFPSSFSSN